MLSPIKSSPSLDNYASSPRSPYQLQHFSDVEESSNESNNVATDAMKDLEITYENTDSIEEFTVELQYQWYDALDSNGSTQLGTGV